ncbi:response regulator [Aquabacter cavernae]|uniref:response regulator n=1 Tax=Aquabacter cavernae TaxID=2496029 RepID=UPI000F8EB2DD|nr:response regulator [Aquabacter cavernae]
MAARILVIEDDPNSRELMRFLLGRSGYGVTLAEDGAAGLAAARRDQPDLIISDIQLPELNGFEVAASIAADPSLRHIPLIAVTASAMAGDRENIIRSGFTDYVSKPIEPETFVVQIAQYLPRRDGA